VSGFFGWLTARSHQTGPPTTAASAVATEEEVAAAAAAPAATDTENVSAHRGFSDADPKGDDRADPITAALIGTTSDGKPFDPRIAKEARRLSRVEGGREALKQAQGRLLQFVRHYPENVVLQLHAARLIERSCGPTVARESWEGIRLRFPGESEAACMTLRHRVREKGRIAARRDYEQLISDLPSGFEGSLLRAMLVIELQDSDEVIGVFDDLLQQYPERELGYLRYSTWLRRRGYIGQAASLLREGIGAARTTSRLRDSLAELRPDIAAMERLLGEVSEAKTVGEQVLERILGEIAAPGTRPVDGSLSFLGATAMITGSLGVGGAERQLTVTSRVLQRAAVSGQPLAGYDILGPVVVVCRSMRLRTGGDFFLRELQQEQIEVKEFQDLPEYGGHPRHSLAGRWSQVMPYLAPQIREGMVRLSDLLRVLAPQVVHIWQDGTVLTAGLAAVLAKVPRIVLNARTLPPIDRPDRYLPEYPLLYRSLLALPGVRLTANNRLTAERYAEWLGVAKDRVAVVYNGMHVPLTAPLSDSAKLFENFAARTPDTRVTVGGVLRFDANKRPMLWLDIAAALQREIGDARFILVGDGPLLPASMERAAQLGIGDRVLFAGHRRDVGFWLDHLDAFLLTSRHEGLPNVLIEAQMLGVPVVSTPAGGSMEAILPEGRDLVLSSAENVDLDEAVTKLAGLLRSERRAALAEQARKWSQSVFSIDQMIAATLDLYCA
jgi:glycosyltransferase involved in cell wall biosynthesis